MQAIQSSLARPLPLPAASFAHTGTSVRAVAPQALPPLPPRGRAPALPVRRLPAGAGGGAATPTSSTGASSRSTAPLQRGLTAVIDGAVAAVRNYLDLRGVRQENDALRAGEPAAARGRAGAGRGARRRTSGCASCWLRGGGAGAGDSGAGGGREPGGQAAVGADQQRRDGRGVPGHVGGDAGRHRGAGDPAPRAATRTWRW